MLGRVLAHKYRLDREIGAGAMGRVYRAHQLDLARDVAIKVLHPMMAEDEGAQLRFAREAKVAARLNHPAAVSVLDYGIDGDVPFLVMELMEGETLRERMTRAALPRLDALAIAADVADALIAAHEIRLIHRDIKPENTFLQRTASGERVRVVDFGLAFLATGEAAVGRMTQDGFVGGTPAYMAPEQVHGRGVGPAADIYGLGCMLYEMIAGHPPFRGSLAELLTSQAYAPAKPLRLLSLTPPVSPELDRLVMAMLAKSVPLRPSPSAVWQMVQEIAADTPSRATAPSYISARSARALGRSGVVAGTMAETAAGSGAIAAAARAMAQGSGHAALRRGGEAVVPGAAVRHLVVGSQAAGAEEVQSGAASAATIETPSGLRTPDFDPDAPRPPGVRVVALGELSDDLELGLIAAGCAVSREGAADPDLPRALADADVIWAPGLDDERIGQLARHAPVVTDLPPGDRAREERRSDAARPLPGADLPASPQASAAAAPATAATGSADAASIEGLLRRLRAGAADLVVDEPTPDQLARKLIRAARRPRPQASS